MFINRKRLSNSMNERFQTCLEMVIERLYEGNMSKAARMSGIGRPYLYHLCKGGDDVRFTTLQKIAESIRRPPVLLYTPDSVAILDRGIENTCSYISSIWREYRTGSQAEIARKVGITRAAYNQFELGRKLPMLSTFEKVCRHLGLQWDYFGLTSRPIDGQLDLFPYLLPGRTFVAQPSAALTCAL